MRAKATPIPARAALPTKHFVPVRLHPSPSGTARVSSAVASLPCSGSVSAKNVQVGAPSSLP